MAEEKRNWFAERGLWAEKGDFGKAIECFDGAIASNPDAAAYCAKGIALEKTGEYGQAVRCFDEAIALAPDDVEAYFNEGDKHESRVAHYTSRVVADALFFGDKKRDENGRQSTVETPFRLNSVTSSNDSEEGKTLFQYLFNGPKMQPQAESYVAFVGCFMFNFDNLNQFRLYGKDGEKEGTGVSVVKIKSLSATAIQDIPKEENLRRFYLEYLPLKGYVSRIYFGPKAESMEVFQNMLAYREEFKDVVCHRSTSPLA